jgi:diguanylate cyclase (GGDEF)-like protein
LKSSARVPQEPIAAVLRHDGGELGPVPIARESLVPLAPAAGLEAPRRHLRAEAAGSVIPGLPFLACALAGYALLYVVLEPLLGVFITTLAAGPAIVAAWFWGLPGAALSAGALALVQLGLPGLLGLPGELPPLIHFYSALQAAMVALVSGGAVGKLREREREQREELGRLARKLSRLERAMRDEPHAEQQLPGEPHWLEADALVEGLTGDSPGEVEGLLWRLAFHDPLTRLPNRALLMERVSELMAVGERSWLLLLDIDRFKVVNDRLGHCSGDALLCAAARRITAAAGPHALVARLGCNAFGVVLSGGDEAAASAVASKVLGLLARPYSLDGRHTSCTASIGIASGGRHAGPRELLRDAELALARAKAQPGCTLAVFNQQMREEVLQRLELEQDLRVALFRQQLHLNYQPIIDLSTGEICGFEALVRWRHPQRGMVLPSTFIPMAEETGMIMQLGAWVIETACDHAQRWHWGPGRRRPLQINVNVSPHQLCDPSLLDHLQGALSSRALPPSALALEITEGAIARDPEQARQVLQQLKAMRLKICVDDFGTGYSSLAHLQQFPVSTVKIDRAFVTRMTSGDPEERQRSVAVVRTIIQLGRDMGLTVVAEGLETPEQLAMLREMGCHKGQGFLFSRPLAPAAAGELLRRRPEWLSAWQ